MVLQQLLRQHEPQLLAAVEGTAVHPPQEPLQSVALVDQLQRHPQPDRPQPVAQVAQEVTAQVVPVLSAAQEDQPWSTALLAALLRAETAEPAEAAPLPVQLVPLVARQLLSVAEHG